MTKVEIENGKYTIELDAKGEVNLYRHGELWVVEPPASKMLIAVMHELLDSRKLLKECYDFTEYLDCSGAVMKLQDKIEEHQKIYK